MAQEVVGSTPTSCTNHLAPSVGNVLEFCWKSKFHACRCAAQTRARRRDVSTDGKDVVSIGRIEIAMLCVFADIDEIRAGLVSLRDAAVASEHVPHCPRHTRRIGDVPYRS